MITAGALFSGIGGFCLGFKAAGIKTVWAVDSDQQAVETYSANVESNLVICEDVRTISAGRLAPVDILHAGFPCQSFSQAGERRGFDDPRGRLFFEVVRILEEFKDKKPKIVVLENSPFLKYGEAGAWFLQVKFALQKAGYWFRDSNACELDTFKLTALPQQRVRLFMVALSGEYFKNGRFDFPNTPNNDPKNLSDYVDFDADVSDEYYLPHENRYMDMLMKHVNDNRSIYQLRKYFVRTKLPGVCPTLTANMGLGGHNVPFVVGKKGLRKLTEYECLWLQGFPRNFLFPRTVPKWKQYHQVGNSVSVPLGAVLGKKIAARLLEGGHVGEGRVSLSGV
jgi:DNA (cytosine-5)-methyltransferase 1